MKCATLHIRRLAGTHKKEKKYERKMSPSLGHTTPPLHTGANRMNKTSAVVVNIVWCRTSAAPHTRTHNHTNAYSHGARGGQRHMHTRTNTRTCTGKVKWAHSKRDRKKNNAPNTHTRTVPHTHTPTQSFRVWNKPVEWQLAPILQPWQPAPWR